MGSNNATGSGVSPQVAMNRVWQNIMSQPSVQQAQARAIINNLDLSNPQNYMQSAYDIANMNTLTSEALAREQMSFQERTNAKAMDFSATEAQKTRDWQTMMSDTAHQREVRDLIAAGINPVLSANQGAAVGSASSAQGVTSSGAKGNVDTSAVSALTQAYVQAKQLEMQEKSLSIQNKNIEAQMLMNALNNETNRYAADKGAAASMFGSGVMASANRYSAEMSKMASQYMADMTYKTYEEGYHGTQSVAGSLFSGLLSGVQDTKPSNAKSLGEWIFGAPSSVQSYQNPNYKSVGDKIGEFLKGLVNQPAQSKRQTDK